MTNETDEKWPQLHDRIEKYVAQLLSLDIKRIEYKPQFSVSLLEMPSEQRERRATEIK
jgi:hypothetical protein